MILRIAKNLNNNSSAASAWEVWAFWLTQRHSDRRERLAKAIVDRETLYATFISDASRVLIESLDNSLDRIDSLLPLYTLVGRIRLGSSQAVVTSAEKLMKEVVDRYSRPNLTPGQLQDLILSPQLQKQVDPMVAFSSVCRGELLALAKGHNFESASPS